jgi:hypothetical protein
VAGDDGIGRDRFLGREVEAEDSWREKADGGRRIGRRPTTATTAAGGSYTGEKITDELRVQKT